MELLSSLILHCDIRCLCVLESVLLVNKNCCLTSSSLMVYITSWWKLLYNRYILTWLQVTVVWFPSVQCKLQWRAWNFWCAVFFKAIKMIVACVGIIYILKHLKAELAWATDNQLRVISNIMLFNIHAVRICIIIVLITVHAKGCPGEITWMVLCGVFPFHCINCSSLVHYKMRFNCKCSCRRLYVCAGIAIVHECDRIFPSHFTRRS